jgi:hypothetical protein
VEAAAQATADVALAEEDVAAAVASAGSQGKQLPAAQDVQFPYDWIVEHVRSFWCTKVIDVSEAQGADHGGGFAAARFTAKRKAFAQLPNEEKLRIVALWLERSSAPDYVADRARSVFVAGVGRRRAGPRIALFTFVGPWAWRTKDGVARHTGDLALGEVVHVLRKDAEVCALWTKMRQHADIVLSRLHAADLACCLELCPRTFEEEHIARLHLHLCGHRNA